MIWSLNTTVLDKLVYTYTVYMLHLQALDLTNRAMESRLSTAES